MLVLAAADVLHRGQRRNDEPLEGQQDAGIRSCLGYVDALRRLQVACVLLEGPPLVSRFILQRLVLADSGVVGGPVSDGEDGVGALERNLERVYVVVVTLDDLDPSRRPGL